jgi:hypothetical protein
MPALLEERSAEREAYRGAARYLDFYPMSDGAVSYDGVHYPYQVNMEKAQIILVRPLLSSISFLLLLLTLVSLRSTQNLLDIMWGQIVANGGLLDE